MRSLLTFILVSVIMLSACRHDEYVDFSEDEPIGNGISSDPCYDGIYLLNEGNMGSNHCTLDFLEFGSGIYHRNIYGQRNPSIVKELGDVGNDIQIYGSKLWIVVNGSNKVEVCDASSARRISQIAIPNGRYLAFDGRYAYISSYVGPIGLDSNAQLGHVYKVDTLNLQKIDSVVVGYQPEEMSIIGRKLYVANSGGYRVPAYDNRLSCIDLDHFNDLPEQIEVGINLHRIEADRYGKLWVSSRGDYRATDGALYCLASGIDGKMHVIERLDIPVADMQLVGDTLWFLSSYWDTNEGISQGRYGQIDVVSRKVIDTPVFEAPEIAGMKTPYGLLVNPQAGDFYLMDARNYVSSGNLLHFLSDGTFDWSVRTGDIPSRGVFVRNTDGGMNPPAADVSESDITVLEYRPAPGQFINILPEYEDGDTPESMAQKCSKALNDRQIICLGGYGGYITFRFGKPISNREGYDFCIYGNCIDGSSEPGIVEVAADTNGNGLPDDPWYELAGSADTDSIGLSHYGYQITYQASPMTDIPWSDNLGNNGIVARNAFHSQEYYPRWLTSPLTFTGTCLPSNAFDKNGNGSYWILGSLRYGYADNKPGESLDNCGFDLDWAVDRNTRNPVEIKQAHFIRVYTGVNQSCGWLGETSTEISGAILLE